MKNIQTKISTTRMEKVMKIRNILLVHLVLCATAFANANENSGTGVVYDAHENAYKTRKIGDHVWTLQNLKLKTPSGSACYKNQQANCDKYGRYYTWAMAMV